MISTASRERLGSDGRLSVDLSPYTYVRTSVMASKLLAERDYRKLVKLGLPEIVQFLEESTYKREMDELAGSESGIQLVEHGIQRNFWRSVDKLRRIADDDTRFFIDVYVWRNDIENIKTLVRGKRAGEPFERLRNILLPGTVTKDELVTLYALPDVESLLRELDLPFIPEPERVYAEEGLTGLETAMTQGYYRLTYRIARRIRDDRALFRAYLLLEIDLMNVLTVLKLKRTGSDVKAIESLLIEPYGYEGPDEDVGARAGRRSLFRRLVHADGIEGALGVLLTSRLRESVKEGIEAYRTSGSLLDLEREFQVTLLRHATRLTHRRPVSADVVVNYLLAKVIETRNILMLIKGKELGVSEEFLERGLVVRT